MALSSAPPPRDTAVDPFEQKGFSDLNVGRKVELSNSFCRFEHIDLVGRVLELYVKDKLVCFLTQNPQGNYNDQTYTITLNNNEEIIMPCPAMGNSMPFPYTFRPADFGMVVTEEEERDLSDVFFQLYLQSDGSIQLVHKSMNPTQCWPVAYRVSELYGGSSDESGERLIDVQQVGPGDSGVLETWMEGCQLYMCTDLVLGNGRYEAANGDNVGFDAKRRLFGIADGLGGHGNDHLASHKGIQQILASEKRLGPAVSDASDVLKRYNFFLEQAQYCMYDGRTGNNCDTTLIAAQLDGCRLSVTNIGDGRWMLLRKGKVLLKSWERASVRGQLVALGILDEKTSYEVPESSPYFGKTFGVLTTLSHYHNVYSADLYEKDGAQGVQSPIAYNYVDVGPEKMTLFLQKGDLFLAMTDGYDAVQDHEIESMLEQWDGIDVSWLARSIKERACAINMKGEYERVFQTGTVKLRAPKDNGSIAILHKE